MKALDFSVVWAFLICWATVCYAKKGFILTAPKAIDAGSTEYFTFTAFEVPSGGIVSLKLLNFYTGSVLAESEVNVLSNMNMWVEMSVPPLPSVLKAKLVVQGNFSDGYRINAEKEVQIRHNSVLTFMQTDKPIYKPSQIVKFRIFPMDSQLRPLGPETVGDVWIEDPSGIRVAQWRHLSFKEGMVQLELPLSNEPPFGPWNIKTVINEVSTTQTFDVEKYVLPKFEVKINPPKVIMIDAETIPFEICAQYSYGKKVDGKLKVKVTYKKHFAYEDVTRIPSVEHSGLISGCHTFIVNTKDILFTRGNSAYREIMAFAEVTENGTEITANATIFKQVALVPLTIQFLGIQETEYFKPGIPYHGQLQVLKRDGEAVTSEKIQVCAVIQYPYPSNKADEKKCQTFITNKKGRVRFILAPQSSSVIKINLIAEVANFHPPLFTFYSFYRPVSPPSATLSLTAWFSPSSNYLQIQTAPDELQCEKLHRLKVRYTAERGASIKFYHKVISRGRLVQQGSHQRTFYPKDDVADRRYDFELDTRNSEISSWLHKASSVPSANETVTAEIGQFDLSFDPRATMSPIARLLIYYVREDGEVVADSRKFRITPCLLNKVNLHFRHEQQYPSTEASMLLSASPASVCGIGLVDKSVRFLKPKNQFQAEKVFEIIEKHDVGKSTKPSQVTADYCMLKASGKNHQQSTIQPSVTPPAMLSHYLTRLESHYVDTSMAFEEAGMVVITDFELETRPCIEREPIASPFAPRTLPRRKMTITGLPGEISSFQRLSNTPLSPENISTKQDDGYQAETKTEEIRNFFPETWLWEMQTVGASGEMALRRKLPHTITQWIGKAVCVHPKTGLGISDDTSITAFQPFFISFRLPYSVVRGEVLPLVVTVFNYLTECLPIKLSLEPSEEYVILSDARSHKMCVCGSESAFHKFVLKPTTLGLVNVTIYGYSMEDDDEVCGNEITARLSARDAVSKQLRVEAEGFPKEEVYNYYICPKNTNGSYATEIDLIPPEDVIDGSARAYVSISGDLMAPALNGLQDLVQLPKGCGEQNMVLFTPNIYVLDYLIASKRATEDIKEECIKNMKTGYQRELLYRHKDGSYSAFGSRDKTGSLWLTAFVLKSFGEARRFIEIDEHDLVLSSNWVLENQFENGCFQPVGTVYSKEMKGGLNDREQSLAPMTAYTLIALIQSGVVQYEQKEVHNAIQCIDEDENPNAYALSLFAYACALAKQNVLAQKYLQYLDDKSINRGGISYWETGIKSSKSVSVEIAGYYILARIELENKDSTDKVLPVVRWLARQRNSNGGFVSTQDTVVGLQALARYASVQSQETIDMAVVVETDGLVKGFKLNEDNKLVTQKVQLPELPTVVDLQAVGDGCALVQFSFRYNVQGVTGSDAFDLNIDVMKLGSNDCNLPRIGICMRYKIPEQSSSMVVVFVKMASGFVPDEESLQALQYDSRVELKRYEVEENSVNLYFDELTNEQKCFVFYVRNEMEVEDIKPATVKICDYYQPELQVTKEYVIPSSCTIQELPELPRLPPLITDEDKIKEPVMVDQDLESSSQSESDLKSITDNPQIPLNAVMDNTVGHVQTEMDRTDDEETATEIPVIRSNIETTGIDGQIKDALSSSLDITVSSETNIQDYTVTSEDSSKAQLAITNSPSKEEVMADDAFRIDGDSSRFSNFVDRDHDLDFPEGIEGNIPVSVLPPSNTTFLTSEETVDCPVCSDEFPDDFDDIYCSSTFALRVIVRDMDTRSVKILQDMSSLQPQPKLIKKFATLLLNPNCECLQLQKKGNVVLIAGADKALWNTEKGKHQVHLTSGVNVILITSKSGQPDEVKRARNACTTDDP